MKSTNLFGAQIGLLDKKFVFKKKKFGLLDKKDKRSKKNCLNLLSFLSKNQKSCWSFGQKRLVVCVNRSLSFVKRSLLRSQEVFFVRKLVFWTTSVRGLLDLKDKKDKKDLLCA